jgi:hypothetical protein
MIIHGGPLKGHEAYVTSNPEPVPERGNFPGFVIEANASDLSKISAAHLSHIDSVWLHGHYKLLRQLPEILWQLPSLRKLSLTDSRLNTQLFKRGIPKGVEHLKITGAGRLVPKGPPNSDVKYLDALIRGFHPRFSPQMFPSLKGLSVHVGRKSDRKDRREMWEVIRSFPELSALYVEPADAGLAWDGLPKGLRRIKLGNGDLTDLGVLRGLCGLEYMHLRFLRSLKTLDGIETFPELKAVVMIGMEHISDYSALLRIPKLEYVMIVRNQCPEICASLEARGVTVQG